MGALAFAAGSAPCGPELCRIAPGFERCQVQESLTSGSSSGSSQTPEWSSSWWVDTESIEEEGIEFRIVDLATLIDLKRKTGRAKDRLMLPVLVALAEELNGSD